MTPDKTMEQLFRAAATGDVTSARAAIEAGADVNASVVRRVTPLHLATRAGHTELVEQLLEHGAHMDARDDWDNTPLHWAAQYGHADVARLLIDQGADITAKDSSQSTPLDYAIAAIRRLKDAAENPAGHAGRVAKGSDVDQTQQR